MANGSLSTEPSRPPRTFSTTATAAKTDAPASTIHPSLVHLRRRVSSATDTTAAAMLPTTSARFSGIAAPERPTARSHVMATTAPHEIDPPHVAEDAALTTRERCGREEGGHDQDHVGDHVRHRVPGSRR